MTASTARPWWAALLTHFNREPYGYTLRPPPVGDQIVDDFLFETRQASASTSPAP